MKPVLKRCLYRTLLSGVAQILDMWDILERVHVVVYQTRKRLFEGNHSKWARVRIGCRSRQT